MKRKIIPFAFLSSLVFSIITCQEQYSTEPFLNKALYKLTHTHIGPCVYCYTDSIGNPVAGADVDIYKGLLKILYLGKTDSTGWVHTVDDLLYV